MVMISISAPATAHINVCTPIIGNGRPGRIGPDTRNMATPHPATLLLPTLTLMAKYNNCKLPCLQGGSGALPHINKHTLNPENSYQTLAAVCIGAEVSEANRPHAI